MKLRHSVTAYALNGCIGNHSIIKLYNKVLKIRNAKWVPVLVSSWTIQNSSIKFFFQNKLILASETIWPLLVNFVKPGFRISHFREVRRSFFWYFLVLRFEVLFNFRPFCWEVRTSKFSCSTQHYSLEWLSPNCTFFLIFSALCVVFWLLHHSVNKQLWSVYFVASSWRTSGKVVEYINIVA